MKANTGTGSARLPVSDKIGGSPAAELLKTADPGREARQAGPAGAEAQEEAASRDRVRLGERLWARRALPLQIAIGLLALVLLVLGWWGIAWLGNYPEYILPAPPAVAEQMWSMLADGRLLVHAGTTVREAALGFLLALVVGTSLGYSIGRSRTLEKFLSPYIAISQGLPIVALAPLLVIWLGDELGRNVVIVALIVFFPILVNSIAAVRSIDRSMLEVARIFGANFWQTIWYVELPLGLRSLLAGVKLGLTLSITGAVIAEFVSSSSGLGFLVYTSRLRFETTAVFVGLVSLAALALAAYMVVTILEKTLINWE
jgi:NitT/TauT family transport system permease protein